MVEHIGDLKVSFDVDLSEFSLEELTWIQECEVRARQIAEIFAVSPELLGDTHQRTAWQQTWKDAEPSASNWLNMIDMLKNTYSNAAAPAFMISSRTHNQICYWHHLAQISPAAPRKLRKCVLRRQAARRYAARGRYGL